MGGGSAVLADLEDVLNPLPSNRRERLNAQRQAINYKQKSSSMALSAT